MFVFEGGLSANHQSLKFQWIAGNRRARHSEARGLMMMRTAAELGLVVAALLIAVSFSIFLLLLYQGKRAPTGNPQYVAMGSSFAAGIGLGSLAPDSPIVCMRTTNGYPQQLAKLLDMPILDVTCSGATMDHVLHGGQYFQRAQLDALTRETSLVTITSGGNDVSYVSDLSFTAARNSHSLSGWAMRRVWRGPRQTGQRDYSKVRRDLSGFVGEVRRRAPSAQIVIVTYPTILPPSGTCPYLNIDEDEAQTFREVGEQLAIATRGAARDSDAILVDMYRLGANHHACPAEPWVNGWVDTHGSQFHPTLLGAQATAAAIKAAIR